MLLVYTRRQGGGLYRSVSRERRPEGHVATHVVTMSPENLTAPGLYLSALALVLKTVLQRARCSYSGNKGATESRVS
jgi:hypothetical protein